MPLIDLTYLRGPVEQSAVDRLTDELVTALLRAERAPDTPFLRANTVLYPHELDPAAVGRRSRPGCAAIPCRHDGLRGCAAAGIEPDSDRAFHFWTLIHEIPEGN